MALLLFRLLTTVVAESIFFWCVGPRSRDVLVVCALINAITNLALNLTLWAMAGPLGISPEISYAVALFLELTVVAVEYLVYRVCCREPGDRRHLLVKTAAANGLSFGMGLVMEHLGLMEPFI